MDTDAGKGRGRSADGPLDGAVAVLGAGSWGTALAVHLCRKGHGDVRLWARNPSLAAALATARENPAYLPRTRLLDGVAPTDSLKEALKGAALAVCVVPSHGLRSVLEKAAPFLEPGCIMVSAAKGLEEKTLMTPTAVMADALKKAGAPRPIAALSGPSFAREVAEALPTAVVAASHDAKTARAVQAAFSSTYFRVYTNPDVAGVELGGALKNVIALASGISDGLKLGSNARAALITRGLAEITRLGVRMGANGATFSGLSGLGDLVLTCTGALSRNYTVGTRIGRGEAPGDVLKSMKMVAEGVRSAAAAAELAAKRGVEMPITAAVNSVIHQGAPAREAVYDLMTRELKEE